MLHLPDKWNEKLCNPTFLTYFLAYSGSLVQNLTLPSRSKALNLFEDLLSMEYGTIIVKQHTSMHAIFQEASDPILQVITLVNEVMERKVVF